MLWIIVIAIYLVIAFELDEDYDLGGFALIWPISIIFIYFIYIIMIVYEHFFLKKSLATKK